MHLFVTGAASFVGAELLRLCDERGIAVTGIDLRDVGRPDCRIADIREAAIADHIPQGVDAVVHMAALSRDADCRGRGAECFDVNVMGTLNLIEAKFQLNVIGMQVLPQPSPDVVRGTVE